MKLFTSVLIVCLCILPLFANGVAIVDGKNAIYLKLLKSEITVTVESQVAVIKSKQTYRNNLTSDKLIKYAFPLAESATATNLSWYLEGDWYTASIAPTPQDTTTPGPGGEVHPNLEEYLGETALYYDLLKPIKKDSLIIIELSYVQLLPYDFGEVSFEFPNDYSLIQDSYIDEQSLYFSLTSPREISSIQSLSSHPISDQSLNSSQGYLKCYLYESNADENYQVKYTLSLEELGLFDLSTYLPADKLPDDLGGFLLFVAEPDQSSMEDVIQKYFTLIVDRSGSMSGSKITQAKDAASFIVNNLNESDKFNIVDFESKIYSFSSSHVDYSPQSRDEALSYINSIYAGGGTNISGAFELAIPQFGIASDSSANIIIFITDGHPTVGITDPNALNEHINTLVSQVETRLSIFTFGIGTALNRQLLALIASNHNGFAEFLESNVLEEKITEFYQKIRNPVLLSTVMSFSPDLITETYPNPLPNLYQGQQMIVAGRYIEPVPTTVSFQGEGAYGHEAFYNYDLSLADSVVAKNQFLPKIWAKLKIEHLLIAYYRLDENSQEAKNLQDQIIELSIDYGVISPFTSYSEPTSIEELLEDDVIVASDYILLGNYPNPFNPSTKISFQINSSKMGTVKIKIYNTLGELIRILTVNVNKPGIYEVTWDGKGMNGGLVSSGTYIYIVDFGDALLGGKMQLLK